MTANELDTEDGRYREQQRRGRELMLQWAIEDLDWSIDLDDPAEPPQISGPGGCVEAPPGPGYHLPARPRRPA